MPPEAGRGGTPPGRNAAEAQSPGFLGPLVAGLWKPPDSSFQTPGALPTPMQNGN